jgi:GNAT superfamily N-acetyltransferase
MATWGPRELPALREITDAALPGEDLSEDELSGLVEEGTLLGAADAGGAALIVGPGRPGAPAAVALIAVVPSAQGRGLGRELLRAAEAHAFDLGAGSVWAGAAGHLGPGSGLTERAGSWSPGPWLWPGVEVHATRALCLFEAAGYERADAVFHPACATTIARPAPAGVDIRRVLEDDDADRAVGLMAEVAPMVAVEVARAVEHGSCLLASEGGEALAVGCHSVHRVGWIGPIAVAKAARRRGLGAALLARLCADLRAAGRSEAEIAWAEPLEFYVRSASASVSRVYRRMVKSRVA